MARVNVGINPKYLSDQHLIAESVEITMITGGLRMNQYKIKSEIPKQFSLGKGHINFFKNKLLYLKKRLDVVNDEMRRRGFSPGTNINLDEFPKNLVNDWRPSYSDSRIIRMRIAERLHTPLKAKNGFHRYERNVIGEDIATFANRMVRSEMFNV